MPLAIFSCGADSTTTYLAGEIGKHPADGRMSDTVIRHAARALNPDRPIMTLAELARRPRSTARSWATGHRRPSIPLLKMLRDMLRERQAIIGQIVPALDHIIMKREIEPVHRTGFNEIRERDGPGSVPRDGRNRRGRSKRTIAL